MRRVGLVAQQTIDRGNLFITPVGKLITEVDFPRQSQSLVKPKPYSLLVGGEIVEPDPQHVLDALKPDRLYQEVRADLSKYSPVEVTRVALEFRDHRYVGVIDSDNTPFRFVLSSRGLKVEPVDEAGVGAAWEEFDRLTASEQRRSMAARRDQAHDEQVAIDAAVEKSMKMKFPDDHRPLVIVDQGPKCANCRYVNAEAHECASPGYVAAEIRVPEIDFHKAAGSHALPPGQDLDDICSDWWKPKKKGKKRVERTGPDAWRFKKALPKKSSETPVKKTPAKKASTKKVGSKGNTRYGYPQESKDKGTPPAAPAAPNPAKVSREPEGDPQVDPAEFANQFGLSIDTLQRVAARFAASEKLGGRDGFASFMRRQLRDAAKKHRLDGDYWGLLFEALTQSQPSSA